ncbi:hypothetical protein DPMN_003488 [Dreissena polymorpha]|uniref:Uncharacterized protein n=1 Tax=Dreissena polymorpha TaxID=45954 RepID=A0A9D4RUT9_DREPO|nr:hypothetical protein DPMN_003488 [Dreissena polymorpha]
MILAHYAAAEGHLPCLKFLVSTGISPTHMLGARNDQGETPKDLAQQFYKDAIMEYINGIEWERDHPEAESESIGPVFTNPLLDLRLDLQPKKLHAAFELFEHPLFQQK